MSHLPRFEGSITNSDWTTAVEAVISPIVESGAYGLVIPTLIVEIETIEPFLGHPPALTQVIWAIRNGLGAPARAGSQELMDALDAFHAISLYTFQTLHSQETFLRGLENELLTAETAATLIWMDWLDDRSRTPIEVAAQHLDAHHRRLGFGAMFTIDIWSPDQIEAVVDPALSAEIIDLTNREA